VNHVLNVRIPIFFLVPFAIAIILGIVLLASLGTAETHLFLNRLNSLSADAFFTSITVAGDGWAAVLAVGILLFISYRAAAAMAAANIAAGVAAQILKRFFFAEVVRPVKFFEGIARLHTVPGIELHSFNSFPSGHAATSFAIWFILAALRPSRTWQVCCCSCAILIALSRVYLSEHFLNDVIAGSALGTGLALWTLFYFQSTNIRRSSRWDGSLLKKDYLQRQD